jgi:hypothetical protein
MTRATPVLLAGAIILALGGITLGVVGTLEARAVREDVKQLQQADPTPTDLTRLRTDLTDVQTELNQAKQRIDLVFDALSATPATTLPPLTFDNSGLDDVAADLQSVKRDLADLTRCVNGMADDLSRGFAVLGC